MFGFASVVWPVEGGGACFTTGRRGGLADTGEGEAVVSRAGTTATRGVVSARALVSTALPPPRNASAAAAPPRTTTAAATIGTSRRFRRGGGLRAEGMAADPRHTSGFASKSQPRRVVVTRLSPVS